MELFKNDVIQELYVFPFLLYKNHKLLKQSTRNIRDVKAFKNTLAMSGVKKAIIVADKGFYSKANITLLREEKPDYIIPLKTWFRFIRKKRKLRFKYALFVTQIVKAYINKHLSKPFYRKYRKG
ncbi:MAG TPA: transposase [Niabella sp.]|jgi:transposase|nr:transposase [Chitinophagaceae bacterium]HRO83252.1 transposase [Niabella sp.]HUN02833.1 transposase [Niabella sp.]